MQFHVSNHIVLSAGLIADALNAVNQVNADMPFDINCYAKGTLKESDADLLDVPVLYSSVEPESKQIYFKSRMDCPLDAIEIWAKKFDLSLSLNTGFGYPSTRYTHIFECGKLVKTIEHDYSEAEA